jgi:hypothetical protein
MITLPRGVTRLTDMFIQPLTLGWHWEIGAPTTTEGGAWNIPATFPIRPIRLP